MSISTTLIANLALAFLGQDPISNLSESTRGARVMNLLYEPTRDAMLRNGQWKFAKTYTSLATSASTPVADYAYYYALPSDYMRWVSSTFTDWRIHGTLIASNDGAPVYLEYIQKVTDPNAFDPLFVQALAAQMSVDACYSLQGDAGLYNRVMAARDEKLADARHAGSLEDPNQIMFAGTFVNSRRGPIDSIPFRYIAAPT